MSATHRLAEFVSGTPVLAVPEAALLAARNALIDTLGVTLAGTAESVSAIVAESVGRTGDAPGTCTLVGRSGRVAPPEAALVNGVAAHALDFDDSLAISRSHPSAPIVSALLAAAESSGATTNESLAALAVSIEVTGRLGRLLGSGHYLKGWHSTATIGSFAAAAAAAYLHRLPAEDLCTAWGLTASRTGGLVRNFGTMTKPFHVGNAARIGVDSVDLVRAGFTADREILDGPDGFLALYAGEDALPPDAALADLGFHWDIVKPGLCVKRWPCCYANHRSIGGLLGLISENGIVADEVNAIFVGFPPEADRALIKALPTSGLEAKFSIEFSLAVTLLYGSPVLSTFRDELPARPEVVNLMRRVKPYAIPDRGVFSGISGYNDLSVETTRGVFKTRIDRVPGSEEWPLTDEERRQKFIGCARVSLSSDASHDLLHSLETFGEEPLAQVLRQTVPQ